MNIKAFAVLAALVGLSSTVFAESFEDQAAAGAAEIAGQVRASQQQAKTSERSVVAQGAPVSYARTIDCAKSPEKSEFLGNLRFYTGLDASRPVAPQSDDTAAKLNDYRRAYFQDGQFHYDAWSCDTQDYSFTFDAETLLKTSPNEKSRPVKGHARVETRGQLDWEGELDCVANF
jgi:hypothetical protein